MTTVVIAGTGIAGITAAEALRSNGFDGTIIMFGEEPLLPYRRTALSKDLVNADLSTDRITLRKPGFWEDRNIEIHPGVTVDAVDTTQKTVTLSDAQRLDYDALILATGGCPRTAGWMSPDVAMLRSHSDAMTLRERLDAREPLVIIGAGLIGSELAASAATAGIDVTMIDAAPLPMMRVLPEPVAEMLANQHRAHGVHLHTGVGVSAATTDHVTFGDEVARGHVVAALGMVPNLTLADAAGLDTATDGIVVDAHLRTSSSGVYAAGDVTMYPHQLTGDLHRSESWMTAGDQGKVVATTVLADLGADVTPRTTPIPLAWTIQYGINIQFAGWPSTPGRLDIDGSLDDLDATVRVFDEDRLVGAVAVGRPADGRRAREEIAASAPARMSSYG